MYTAFILSLNLQIAYVAPAHPAPLAAAVIDGEWPVPGTADWAKSSGPPAEALELVVYTFYTGVYRASGSNCVSLREGSCTDGKACLLPVIQADGS